MLKQSISTGLQRGVFQDTGKRTDKAGYAMEVPRIVTGIDEVPGLADEDIDLLKLVEEKYPFFSNEYYLSLINWEDKKDPIRRIIIPDPDELDTWGELDPSCESENTVVKGIQHKYGPTALMIISDSCGGVCRYCFRKRIFLDGENSETVGDTTEAIEYIKNNTGISNVLLTGGDPLTLSTPELESIIRRLREIDHVKIIRIGSRMLSFNPIRISGDSSLIEMIKKYSRKNRRIYIMTHFSHPRELTDVAVDAISSLINAGAILTNQTPILRGVNDNPDVLCDLLSRLSETGVTPYYLFQCRPTLGNYHFSVPIEETYELIKQAKTNCSGLAKRVKFIMSHRTGKIEILAADDRFTYMKYHQSAESTNNGKFMVFNKNPDARWLEDYKISVRK